MFACRFVNREMTEVHSSSRLACLALFCALMLIYPQAFTVRSAQAEHTPAHTPEWTDFNTHDPGIVIASGSATQAIALLMSNLSAEMPGRSCHFSGAVRSDEIPPPFGSGLRDPVFSPVSLAPGESLAIDIPPPDFGVAPNQVRVLIMGIEADNAVSRFCPVLVQAMGYDHGSGATEVLIHRFTFGLERTFALLGRVHSSVPLGFVGGNAGQAARLTLVSDDNSPLPTDRCALAGEVVAQFVPRLAEDWADQAGSVEKSWPIEWQGPTPKSVAVVDVSFDDAGDHRVDVLLSLRFDHPLPAACLKRLNGSLQVFDQTTGTTRAVVPTDRVFLNYLHFHN